MYSIVLRNQMHTYKYLIVYVSFHLKNTKWLLLPNDETVIAKLYYYYY
jgi:hypothetical protein